MKNIYLLFLFLVLISCSSSKTDKILYQKTFDYFKDNKVLDSLEVVKSTFVIEKILLDYYKIEKENFKKNITHSGSTFNWLNNDHKWLINDLDLKYMYSEIKTQKLNNFEYFDNLEQEMFIDLVDYPNIYLCKDLESYINKFYIDNKALVSFSNPLYNKNKTIAIVVVKAHFVSFNITFIFEKRKNKWDIVALLSSR